MPVNTDITQSKSVQDFLKAVYSLQPPQPSERVSTNALAEGLNVKAPSITDMALRLEEAGLVDYEKYKGVRLTDSGEALALKIIRRHRLIELYLVKELGYELGEVHNEAENLEHAVSDRFVEAIASRLGNPEFDPHGDPIPAPDGTMTRRELEPLAGWPPHEPAVVCRFVAENPAMLQHILDRGFKLGATVTVQSADPFEGPVSVTVDGESRVIGHQVASAILVEAAS